MKLSLDTYELVRTGRDEIAAELARLEAGEADGTTFDASTLRRMLECLDRELAENRASMH